jgi:hypothetical protein
MLSFYQDPSPNGLFRKTMSESTGIYIASISGGKCITNKQASKSECRIQKWAPGSKEQQWIVEPEEGKENVVAFRSTLDNKYLANLEPRKTNGGKLGVGEKQLFELVKAEGKNGTGPSWFHVKSLANPEAFFNDEWGRWKEDNKIQFYKYEV